MRILLVEDDESLVARLEPALATADPNLDLDVARSRDAAYELIRINTFDLMVCDLRIPTTDETSDAQEQHGLAVIERCAKEAQGTPILILSAFATRDLLQDLLRAARPMDPFGSGSEITMVDLVQKRRLHELVDRVEHFSKEVMELNDIAVDGQVAEPLLADHERILQVFARWYRGLTVEVRELSGGLSSSRAMRVEVFDDRHNTTALAVGKLDEISRIEDEEARCRNYVAPVVRPGGFTPHMATVAAGTPRTGGLFYSLADGYESSLFDLLRGDQASAARSVSLIHDIEDAWLRNAPFAEVSIEEVRRMCISDEDFANTMEVLPAAEIEVFENRRVQIHSCVQHGDLHPGNILIRDDGSPILIDFGRVGEMSAAIDPVTLEFSILFHPSGAEILGDWPTLEQAKGWTSAEQYLMGCPVPDFIAACRKWADDVSSTRREHLAAAYGFLIRQLKFKDTNHNLAATMAAHAIESFSAPLGP